MLLRTVFPILTGAKTGGRILGRREQQVIPLTSHYDRDSQVNVRGAEAAIAILSRNNVTENRFV